MKYWGKKPHNIWRSYIENYTPEGGVYLDPFAGSAMSAFEAVKAGRKAIAFDLNPLTSFSVEVISTEFDQDRFTDALNSIVDSFIHDEIYNYYFTTESRKKPGTYDIVQNFKWDKKGLYELGVIEPNQESLLHNYGASIEKYLTSPNEMDHSKSTRMEEIIIDYWFPNEPFHKSPSFSANFIKCIGGNNFKNLWTRRNLYVISKIFDQIINQSDENIKIQLLFGFIQTIHLCTKMCVPRRPNADRPYSTSWGRSAFICANRKMEMNPLLVFQGNCFGKQSVASSLSSVKEYLGVEPKLVEVSHSHKNKTNAFDIKYGIVDINVLPDYLEDDSVDFIMTDPPYGGLVQYLDLSSLWLNWLKKYDKKYQVNFDAEITIKTGVFDLDIYQRRFTNAIKMLYRVLKPEGKIVFTFHNKDLKIWNSFLKSIALAGFKIEKVIHQQNRRTGESNVANPYGTSGSDFYIRCRKEPFTCFETDRGKFIHFVTTKAIEIIGLRNEPTPYEFLLTGLLTEISSAGFDLENFDDTIHEILQSSVGKIFSVSENSSNKAGKLWWFIKPDDYIKHPNKMLTDRVSESIRDLLRRETIVTLDQVLAEIFVNYPNGLTPDVKSIESILKKYAKKSSGKWLYNSDVIEKDITEHTRYIYLLSNIGKKLGYKIFIGKREQREKINGKTLASYADYTDLDCLQIQKEVRNRIEMIDLIWLDKNIEVNCAIEVENSTNFSSGIQRGSNLDNSIRKIMVIPNERDKEFLSTRDPLFVDSFTSHNWKYLFYDSVEKLEKTNKLTEETIEAFLTPLQQ